MATPRYQFRLEDLRNMAKNGHWELPPHGKPPEQQVEDLADRVQALAQELLRLRRREVLRMGGFER